jgi:hypothetical protein
MLTFCARCPALVERLLASGSARLEHLPGALRWLQEGPRLRPLLDGPGWSRTTARRFEVCRSNPLSYGASLGTVAGAVDP